MKRYRQPHRPKWMKRLGLNYGKLFVVGGLILFQYVLWTRVFR